jgi:hypothetical protein
MSSSVYKENSVTTASVAAENSTDVTLNFNCPNVITKTIIAVHTDGTGKKGDYQSVDKIQYFMSGRLVHESTGVECQKLENSLFYGTSYGAGEIVGSDDVQNVYTHFWGVSNERNRFSGGCSGKNISDFSAKIFLKNGSNGALTYVVEAQHEYVNIVSISGASGKIGVSLSL